MSRITESFAKLKTKNEMGLVTYLTVGYPDVESAAPLVISMVEAGADLVELGIPFSDPLADGTTIQRAGYNALRNGVSTQTCLDVALQIRKAGVKVPILFMGYYNPILSYGLDRFCAACEEAEVDGLIIPDLPPEEASELKRASSGRGIDLVFLLAPTSTVERIEKVAGAGSGFVYCVSLTGVTGARSQMSTALPAFLARVRTRTELPVAVGFGISTREHVQSLTPMADAAVVGSAIIDLIEKTQPELRPTAVGEFVKKLKD